MSKHEKEQQTYNIMGLFADAPVSRQSMDKAAGQMREDVKKEFQFKIILLGLFALLFLGFGVKIDRAVTDTPAGTFDHYFLSVLSLVTIFMGCLCISGITYLFIIKESFLAELYDKEMLCFLHGEKTGMALKKGHFALQDKAKFDKPANMNFWLDNHEMLFVAVSPVLQQHYNRLDEENGHNLDSLRTKQRIMRLIMAEHDLPDMQHILEWLEQRQLLLYLLKTGVPVSNEEREIMAAAADLTSGTGFETYAQNEKLLSDLIAGFASNPVQTR